MKALLSRQPGGPETLTLEDLPEPQPGPGQVRIAVRAVGVNFPDLLIIQDLYQIKPPRPFSPGGELAGVVDTVGEGVTNVKPGDLDRSQFPRSADHTGLISNQAASAVLPRGRACRRGRHRGRGRHQREARRS